MQQHNKLHYVNKVYQTEAYQLNIIEKDDNFSTDPLNENMEKLDDTLLAAHMGAVAEHDQRTSETADLKQRVTALEVHKIAVGSYEGNNAERTISLPFTPVAVLIFPKQHYQFGYCGMAVTGSPTTHVDPNLSIVSNGFTLHPITNNHNYLNQNGQTYHYLALA